LSIIFSLFKRDFAFENPFKVTLNVFVKNKT
jgi:hypothetical protein